MGMLSTIPGIKSKMLPVLLIAGGLLLALAKPAMSLLSPVKLQVQILPAPVIMPSIYKVYANKDALEGKYSLFKMIVTNTSSRTAENVEVSCQIPNYIETSVFQKIPKIMPGQTVVVNYYPNFSDKIVEKTTSSKESVNITIKGSNIKTVEESFDIQCKGRNEFMYSFIPADEIRTRAENFDNMELLSCLVTPEDPVIKYLTQKIQEKLLRGEAASVTNSDKEGVRVMMGIYEATYLSHMVYSGTSGVPEKIGDVSSMVQSIRLPREVITGKTGLCIELTLMYASIMMCAGMDPVIYLIPGHAFPGFRMNGRLYAIESTGINGEGMGGRYTAQQALELGDKKLTNLLEHFQYGDPDYMIIDVRGAIKDGAVAMELKDDNYLRSKIDEIAQSFDGSGGVPSNVQPNSSGSNYSGGGDDENGGQSGDENDGGDNTGGLPAGYNLYQGVVTFGYPGNWRIQPRTPENLPQSKHVIANGAKNTYIEVYSFPGFSNPEQGIRTLQQAVSKYGGTLRYQTVGQAGNYTIFNGSTVIGNFSANWLAAFKNNGNSVAGIAVGALRGVNAKATIEKIISTLR